MINLCFRRLAVGLFLGNFVVKSFQEKSTAVQGETFVKKTDFAIKFLDIYSL